MQFVDNFPYTIEHIEPGMPATYVSGTDKYPGLIGTVSRSGKRAVFIPTHKGEPCPLASVNLYANKRGTWCVVKGTAYIMLGQAVFDLDPHF